MEWRDLFPLLLGLVTASLGFFLKRLIADLDGLRRDFEKIRADSARESARIRDTYVKYEDFVRLQTSIDAKLSQIYELLAGGGR